MLNHPENLWQCDNVFTSHLSHYSCVQPSGRSTQGSVASTVLKTLQSRAVKGSQGQSAGSYHIVSHRVTGTAPVCEPLSGRAAARPHMSWQFVVRVSKAKSTCFRTRQGHRAVEHLPSFEASGCDSSEKKVLCCIIKSYNNTVNTLSLRLSYATTSIIKTP